MSWPTSFLREVVTINPRHRSRLDADTAVSFLSMADVDTNGTTSRGVDRPYGLVAKGYTPFADGDVLVAKITPCFENGKIAQARIDREIGAGSTEFHVLRPDPNIINARYLLHFLRQSWIRAAGELRMTGSAGQRRVPESFLAGLELPVPPLTEQRRIADVLDRVGLLRSKRSEAASKLADFASLRFLEVFGNPRSNPHGWPLLPLGDAISFGPQNGIYKPSSDYGSGTPIVRINSFYGGIITRIDDLERVKIGADERLKFGLNENDILINRVNSRSHLGKSAIVPSLTEETVFESNMMRFAINIEAFTPHYIISFLQTRYAKSWFLSRAKDAVNQSSINQTDVKSMLVPQPPLHMQRKFLAESEAIVGQVAISRHQGHVLDQLFAALQHRAFAGTL